MGESVASYLIDKLAFILEQHLTLVSEVEASAARLSAGAREHSELVKSLENLRSLRESLMQIFSEIQNRAETIPSSYLDDAFALIGYYIEAAAKGEMRALQYASRFVDVKSDIEEVEALVAKAKILLSNITHL
jgi:sialic acid synthase SpsE